MKNGWAGLQKVNISDDHVTCRDCGAVLSTLTGFTWEKKATNTATTRDELCRCKTCGAAFVMHYDLFDPEGHVYPRVFTGDINNKDYNWQDILTEEQKQAIKDHLEKCQECTDRLSNEMLADAWFGAWMEELRAKAKIKLPPV